MTMLTMTHCIRWHLHWYCHVWIIVTVCLPAAHSLHTVCSVCKTLLLTSLWCFRPDVCTTSPEAAPLAASVEQNSIQTVYFNVSHQSWYCSTISIRTRPALWRHPVSVQCARQLCRFMYRPNWQSLFHRRATCLEGTAFWYETDLISYQLPQEAQDTLFQSHLVETFFISF